MKQEQALKTSDVAELLGVSIKWVARLIDEGSLEGWRIPGGRERRVAPRALYDFMQRHDIPTARLQRMLEARGVSQRSSNALVALAEPREGAELAEALERGATFTADSCADAVTMGMRLGTGRYQLVIFELGMVDPEQLRAACAALLELPPTLVVASRRATTATLQGMVRNKIVDFAMGWPWQADMLIARLKGTRPCQPAGSNSEAVDQDGPPPRQGHG